MYRFCLLVFVLGCGAKTSEEPDLGPSPASQHKASPISHELNPRLVRRFQPLRVGAVSTSGTERDVTDLGKMLFFEPRLSKHNNTSCSSCHPLERAGADPRATSIGTDGEAGTRNAPPVFNAVRHFAQFWDGRASNLESQAKGPLTNPNEMAMTGPEIVSRLRGIPGYVAAFGKAFPDEAIDLDHVAGAIAAFERTLVTPARWDRYLLGDRTALSARELEGVKLFADVGCVQCHTGELIGGSMFQKVGVSEPWPNQKDQGRFEITHQDVDRMVFKVPSLRNITLTAPYFHDGSVQTLPDAIRRMARYQLATELTDAEVESIIAWFGALTSELPKIEPPVLP
jgi:cytochrome c peroxidase